MFYQGNKIVFFVFGYLVVLFIFSFLLHFMEFGYLCDKELKVINELRDIKECIWFIALVISGMGHTVATPKSYGGKIITIITLLFEISITILIIGCIFSFIFFTENEGKAFSKLQKTFCKENKEMKATNVIKMICKMREYEYKINSSFSDCYQYSGDEWINKYGKNFTRSKIKRYLGENYLLSFLLHFYLRRFKNYFK